MQEIISAFPIIPQVLPWLFGAIGGFLIALLRNRRPLITYSVSHQRIGMTAEDDVHGRVEVRYAERVVQNLFLTVMEVENRSTKDLENLSLKTYRGSNDAAMLTEQLHIKGTLERVSLTQDYLDRVTTDRDWERGVIESGAETDLENAKRLAVDARFRAGQRHYIVPLLNRGQAVKITYLVETAPNATPTIFLDCQTKGVRLKLKSLPLAITNLWGVGLREAAITGIFVGSLLAGVAVWQISTYWVGALVCFLVGVLANIPGALTVKMFRWLREKAVG